jgi:hypothetical protein
MPTTQALVAPVALGEALSARLDDALRSGLRGEGFGEALLQGALGDPSVRTVVLALAVQGPPAAHVLQLLRAPGPLAQWEGLSCI